MSEDRRPQHGVTTPSNREPITKDETSLLIVTDDNPTFPIDQINWGKGVVPHHALEIGPGFQHDECALRLAIILFRPSGKRDTMEIYVDPDELVTKEELVKKADFLIRTTTFDWLTETIQVVIDSILATSVIHFGKLLIKKAEMDDMTGDWAQFADDGDKLGLVIEFKIFNKEAFAYIPYEDAAMFFDFTPNVLDYDQLTP